MTLVPARRRSVVSVVLGSLAMAGSFAVMGVLVLSDVADAEAPQKAVPEKVASVEQSQTATAPGEQLEGAPVEATKPVTRPAPKKRARKHAKVDFGRFEGY